MHQFQRLAAVILCMYHLVCTGLGGKKGRLALKVRDSAQDLGEKWPELVVNEL